MNAKETYYSGIPEIRVMYRIKEYTHTQTHTHTHSDTYTATHRHTYTCTFSKVSLLGLSVIKIVGH